MENIIADTASDRNTFKEICHLLLKMRETNRNNYEEEDILYGGMSIRDLPDKDFGGVLDDLKLLEHLR